MLWTVMEAQGARARLLLPLREDFDCFACVAFRLTIFQNIIIMILLKIIHIFLNGMWKCEEFSSRKISRYPHWGNGAPSLELPSGSATPP